MPHDRRQTGGSGTVRLAKRLFVAPQFASWLDSLGLRTAGDFLDLKGEIISGHPRRHVMRLIVGGEECYLKKEHQVNRSDRLKNAWMGFGFVSSSIREAMMLAELREQNIACPEWIAAGEIDDGRAFLLIRALPGRINLREALETGCLGSRQNFRFYLRQLAAAVAKLHDSGIRYPDLVAKHVLLSPDGRDPAFLDWQRGWRGRRVAPMSRARDLAALHASIRSEILRPYQRWRFLVEYGRASGLDRSTLRRMCSSIFRRAKSLERRSSFREQRLPGTRTSQSLFWQDSQRLCVTELGRRLFLPQELLNLAYSTDGPRAAHSTQLVRRNTGATAILVRRRSILTIWQRLEWHVRGSVFLSDECREAASLLRSERLGQPPRLLAFGQWERSKRVIDSFLLYLADGADVPCLRGDRYCQA